jgi:hypothetical protein
MRFETFQLIVILQEEPYRHSTLSHASRNWNDGRIEQLGWPRLELTYRFGTRIPEALKVHFTRPNGPTRDRTDSPSGNTSTSACGGSPRPSPVTNAPGHDQDHTGSTGPTPSWRPHPPKPNSKSSRHSTRQRETSHGGSGVARPQPPDPASSANLGKLGAGSSRISSEAVK